MMSVSPSYVSKKEYINVSIISKLSSTINKKKLYNILFPSILGTKDEMGHTAAK